jgi:hypothetical protein
VLTNYPEHNDVMTLLDGGLLVAYMLAAALVFGLATTLMLTLAARCLGRWRAARFHHLTQALIPLAGAGVFLGLSSVTVTQLRSDGISLPFVGEGRVVLLVLASLWSGLLAWRITGLYAEYAGRRAAALCAFCVAMIPANTAWLLLFRVW